MEKEKEIDFIRPDPLWKQLLNMEKYIEHLELRIQELQAEIANLRVKNGQ